MRVGCAGGWVCWCAINGVGEGFGGGLVEEGAGLVFDDGVECAAGAEADDGASAGLCFDAGDAEVFYLWEKEAVCALVEGAELVVADLPEEADGGVCVVKFVLALSVCAECFFVRAGADDGKGAVGLGGGGDGEVDAFVGFEGGDEQEFAGALD